MKKQFFSSVISYENSKTNASSPKRQNRRFVSPNPDEIGVSEVVPEIVYPVNSGFLRSQLIILQCIDIY